MKQHLSPTLKDLKRESVLVQAWKKCASHLRNHSWYADTLAIDYHSLRLPRLMADLQKLLRNPDEWVSDPLELVPAPKTQSWEIRNEKWEPRESIKGRMRPLAHVSLKDQIVATALMMCLADRVETAKGDPRKPFPDEGDNDRVLAFGHRLFCDLSRGQLRHRWGSAKLYRQYFQDYQSFLERPKVISTSLEIDSSTHEIAIVQSDISKFYDRVRPPFLMEKLHLFKRSSKEDSFFELAEKVLNWRWSDHGRATRYGAQHGIPDFTRIALPQGLVASGFFANIAMHSFESALRDSIGAPIDRAKSIVLKDACYYVDDIRLVLCVIRGESEADIERKVVAWLQQLLNKNAPGLVVEQEKTTVTVEGRDRRFLVPQSKAATRIQKEVSGTFDMLHGTELIGAIEGFFHTQQRYSTAVEPHRVGRTGLLVGVSDMRDETAARFAAGKFRKTFRSLRPLLVEEQSEEAPPLNNSGDEDEVDVVLPFALGHLVLSKQQLDARGKLFAALLIEEWTANPANVRLLRIAFDMYPDAEFLERVLELLRPGWNKKKGAVGPKREVRTYCLAELFRAGATETGIVSDDECLPSDASTEEYHSVLIQEAREVLSQYATLTSPGTRFPWYLMQQVYLYLAVRNALPKDLTQPLSKRSGLLSEYRQFAAFLFGQVPSLLEKRAIYVAIASTGFGIADATNLLKTSDVSEEFLGRINEISPTVARLIWLHFHMSAGKRLSAAARALGLDTVQTSDGEGSLASFASRPDNPFFEEENLLRLAKWLFKVLEKNPDAVVTPWQIFISVSIAKGYRFGKLEANSLELRTTPQKAVALFIPPDWCETADDRRKYQIGLLLRFALRGSTGFYDPADLTQRSAHFRYRKSVSHWELQRYSGFQGRSSFGPPWLPISSFTESLLFELLRWPGSGLTTPYRRTSVLKTEVLERLKILRKRRGTLTSEAFLEQRATWPTRPPNAPWRRALRVGVVQTITPSLEDYASCTNDPELNTNHALRSRQRAHLAASLEGVAQMLRVRDTHRRQERSDGRTIDLLVLPELAVHPNDIDSLIIPFVRVHKCMMLFGQVYHRVVSLPDAPLINSCLWLVPEWSSAGGFQIRRIEQGKKYITTDETAFVPTPVGFRPAQWLIEYDWHSDSGTHRPLVLSASVCYDATDLALASDLSSLSDVYLICALNKDVGTFDRMSEGLHYHMFQAIIVVNNGQFGGSSCFVPFSTPHHRQVFHLHGQPQVSIAFAEISPEKLIYRPTSSSDGHPTGEWKKPPAGWISF